MKPFSAGWLAAREPHDQRARNPAVLDALAAAVARFERAGYRVIAGRSDWRLEPADGEMQAAVLDVWASAASEEGGLPLAEGVAWLTRRRDLVAAGRSAMHLGHVDFLALPDRNRQR